jgi:putative transposase
MSDPIDRDEQRTAAALFKYTLILPLLRGEYPPGGKGRLREQIAAGRYEIPNSSRTTVSVPTLARWERIYRKEGFEGLKPKPRSDRGQLRALSAKTLDRAETLKREQPRRSTRTLVAMLSQDQTNPIPEESIAPRTLRRHLALRNATAVQLLHPQRPKPYQRFERNHFGDLWQGDAMHGPKLPNPAKPDKKRQVFLFAFLDDHTRLVPHAQFYWNEQLPRLEDCFKRAMLRYGRPLAIYADRGKVYTSKHMNTICASLGVQRILGTPYYPEGRGKIERFFQFVQSDFLPELATSAVDTLPLLNQSLLAWLEVVYHRKLHSETGQSPLERMRQDPAPAVRPVDPHELRQAFLHRETRKVTKTATFAFKNNRYSVPAFLRRQTIQIRYDPLDLTHMEVWHRDTFLQLAEPEQIVTTTHPDVKPDPAPVPPANSGMDYLAVLRLERDRLLQEQLDGIHFTQLPSPATKSTKEKNDERPQ